MVWGTGKAATEFSNMLLELFCQCPGLPVLLAKEGDGLLSITF
jgi:hypothetical protein